MQAHAIVLLSITAFPVAPLPAWAVDPEDQTPKVIATANWPSNQLGRRLGYSRGKKAAATLYAGLDFKKADDPAFQKEADAKLAKLFKVNALDWSKQMVILAEAGRCKTGGYTVEVTSLEVKDKNLIVKWKLNEPKPGSDVPKEASYPAIVLLVDRFDGDVIFDPPAK
jgi:hypothetical protein